MLKVGKPEAYRPRDANHLLPVRRSKWYGAGSVDTVYAVEVQPVDIHRPVAVPQRVLRPVDPPADVLLQGTPLGFSSTVWAPQEPDLSLPEVLGPVDPHVNVRPRDLGATWHPTPPSPLTP